MPNPKDVRRRIIWTDLSNNEAVIVQNMFTLIIMLLTYRDKEPIQITIDYLEDL